MRLNRTSASENYKILSSAPFFFWLKELYFFLLFHTIKEHNYEKIAFFLDVLIQGNIWSRYANNGIRVGQTCSKMAKIAIKSKVSSIQFLSKLAFELYQFQNTLTHLASPTDWDILDSVSSAFFLYCIFLNIWCSIVLSKYVDKMSHVSGRMCLLLDTFSLFVGKCFDNRFKSFYLSRFQFMFSNFLKKWRGCVFFG